MVSSWIYLTIGVMVALVGLGAFAINIALHHRLPPNTREGQNLTTTELTTKMPLPIPANLNKYTAADYAAKYNSITESKDTPTESVYVECGAVRIKKFASNNYLVWTSCGGSANGKGLFPYIAELYSPKNCWMVSPSSIERKDFSVCEKNFSNSTYGPSKVFVGFTNRPSKGWNVGQGEAPQVPLKRKEAGIPLPEEKIREISYRNPLTTISNVTGFYPFHILEFNITEDRENIRSVEVKYSQSYTFFLGVDHGANLYIWNSKDKAWQLVDTVSTSSRNALLSGRFENIDEILDENNTLRLLAVASYEVEKIATTGAEVTIG